MLKTVTITFTTVELMKLHELTLVVSYDTASPRLTWLRRVFFSSLFHPLANASGIHKFKNKNNIFLTEQDYAVFLYYLKEYLSPPRNPTQDEIAAMRTPYLLKNYSDEIELISFCLMPNHFHLLLKQLRERSIEHFMRSLLIRYSQYMNKNKERVGHLYQGVYRGILIEQDEYLWWLSRYVHRNPLEILGKDQKLEDYPYSSYPAFLNIRIVPWLRPEIVLAYIKNYRQFVESPNESAPEKLTDLIIEDPGDF